RARPLRPFVSRPPAWLRGTLSALPDFALALFILSVWQDPLAHGDRMVGNLLLLMLLEFIIVHASGFMASIIHGPSDRLRKVGQLFLLGLLESVFVGGFSLSFGAWWPLASFWGLTVNRMLGVLLNPPSDQDNRIILGSQWAMSVVFYLGGVFLTLLGPVPRLGLTPDVMPRLGLTGGGIWIDQPWRVLAFGVTYFATQGAWALIVPFLFHGPESASRRA
ncbi:MAG TPA: hypothetical protein VF720_12535, partial [Candidatus Eisenbacteria bacterium]